MIADRCELNRQIKADNTLLRELKEKVKQLKQAVMDSITAIAEALETIRDRIVMLQYQFMYNSRQIGLIEYTIEKQKPLLREYHAVRNQIKEKQAERRTLVAERKACSSLKVAKIGALTRQITTLTEDIEELISQKVHLLSKLKCDEDKEIQTAEKRITDMEKTRERLLEQQEKLPSDSNRVAGEYIRMENTVPAEQWNQVKEHRRIIFLDHWETLLQKLKEIYGARFNRELYDDVQ